MMDRIETAECRSVIRTPGARTSACHSARITAPRDKDMTVVPLIRKQSSSGNRLISSRTAALHLQNETVPFRKSLSISNGPECAENHLSGTGRFAGFIRFPVGNFSGTEFLIFRRRKTVRIALGIDLKCQFFAVGTSPRDSRTSGTTAEGDHFRAGRFRCGIPREKQTIRNRSIRIYNAASSSDRTDIVIRERVSSTAPGTRAFFPVKHESCLRKLRETGKNVIAPPLGTDQKITQQTRESKRYFHSVVKLFNFFSSELIFRTISPGK